MLQRAVLSRTNVQRKSSGSQLLRYYRKVLSQLTHDGRPRRFGAFSSSRGTYVTRPDTLHDPWAFSMLLSSSSTRFLRTRARATRVARLAQGKQVRPRVAPSPEGWRMCHPAACLLRFLDFRVRYSIHRLIVTFGAELAMSWYKFWLWKAPFFLEEPKNGFLLCGSPPSKTLFKTVLSVGAL